MVIFPLNILLIFLNNLFCQYACNSRFNDCIAIQDDDTLAAIQILVKLFTQAISMGKDTLNALLTTCSYSNFPFAGEDKDMQMVFLLTLFSNQTEEGLLPALLPLYQSVPPVWVVDLSNGKMSVLLEILKLQELKRQVELKDMEENEEAVDELRSFLQCLPYVSQLR